MVKPNKNSGARAEFLALIFFILEPEPSFLALIFLFWSQSQAFWLLIFYFGAGAKLFSSDFFILELELSCKSLPAKARIYMKLKLLVNLCFR